MPQYTKSQASLIEINTEYQMNRKINVACYSQLGDLPVRHFFVMLQLWSSMYTKLMVYNVGIGSDVRILKRAISLQEILSFWLFSYIFDSVSFMAVVLAVFEDDC